MDMQQCTFKSTLLLDAELMRNRTQVEIDRQTDH